MEVSRGEFKMTKSLLKEVAITLAVIMTKLTEMYPYVY